MKKSLPRLSAAFTIVQLLVVLALVAVLIAFLLPLIQRTREKANLALCKDHLRQIGVGLIEYARLNASALPVSSTVENPHADLLQCLSVSGCVGDPRNYYCPAQQQSSFRFSDQNFRQGIISYFYYSALASGGNPALSKFLRTDLGWPRTLDTSMDKKSWVMSDAWYSGVQTAHSGYRKGLNYLMLDGSVDFVSDSPRQAFH
jgi:prepilin-type processing-associated H-X9-DG protein